jgi:hypothetical protein
MRETGGILLVRVDAIEIDDAFAASHHELKPGPHVRITVQDTGHGMDAETLERIFEPFFTTKEVGEGSGMGLAVVHGIITSHEGTITVESSPGEGTTVAIFFPCLNATAGDTALPEQRFMIGGLFYLGAPALLLWAHKQQLASQLMDPILLIPVSNWS